MEAIFLSLGFAFLIGLVHFFGEELDEYLNSKHLLLASFSAGLTVSYFFLAMLPEMSKASVNLEYEFLFALAGFSFFYIVEELIYQRESNLSEVKKEFKELHSAFIFSYHFAIGFLIYFLMEQGQSQALLFYIPVLVHTAVNSLAIKEMHEEMLDKLWIKLSASFSAVLGAITAYLVDPSQFVSYSVFGFIGGMFLYIVVHDALDPKRERPIGFIIGATIFSIIVFLL
ncbi:MAG: hypothetical protein R6V35_01445 [Candidatus Nanohaloarchaea archaeon]